MIRVERGAPPALLDTPELVCHVLLDQQPQGPAEFTVDLVPAISTDSTAKSAVMHHLGEDSGV